MKFDGNTTLTDGPIFKTLFCYSLPIIITNLFQLLFHVMDVTVLAVMANDSAVAAVGACGSLVTLLVGIFTGFATGANVLVAKRVGSQNVQGIKKAIGASLTIGLASGVILMIPGIIFARDFLVMTNCQPDVIDAAVSYLVTYFSGMPVIMLYNFVASVFSAMGDSIRPMKYMLISGVINTVLNVFFVGVFDLAVVGVALATVISNVVSLSLALISLLNKNKLYKINSGDLIVGRNEITEIVKVGIPTCFCSVFFYVANVILSSAVNLISTDAMTANAISGQFDGIIYNVGCSVAIAASVIVGQNFGARRYVRIPKIMRASILYAVSLSLSIGIIFTLFSDALLGLMTDSPTIIAIAKDKMILLCLTYFITSIMEVFAFSLRAMNKPGITMVVGGICGLGIRGMWVWLIWPLYPTLSVVFQSYAVSAFVAIIIYLFVYCRTMKQLTSCFAA